MKVSVCGKGGCGKSTVVALLSKEIAQRNNKVLVIDNDESNIDLHYRLGMTKPQDFMKYFGGKKILFQKAKKLTGKWKLDDLHKQYLSEKGNIQLLSMGKIYQFGEGCARPINALSPRILEILELADKEFLIADTDAGIEHLGKGVENGIDALLVVVEPSQDSILPAEKISGLGNQLGKATCFVLSKANKESQELLLEALDEKQVIAAIPENRDIFLSTLAGKELEVSLEPIKQIADMCEPVKSKAQVELT